jgi:hypothetical protein
MIWHLRSAAAPRLGLVGSIWTVWGILSADDISLHFTLNLATDDLKAYYFEAITAQPGQESPSSQVLSDWFYDETMAGKVLFALRDRANEGEDGMMKLLGNVLIIPAAQTEKRMKMAS